MSRMEGWKKEIHDGIRRENWSLNGPNRIVKVKPISPINNRHLASADGYITKELFLNGKTPIQIQQALGLQPGSLARGCRIYRFTRLPMSSEYEYELTAFYPDGLAFNSADLEEAFYKFSANSSSGVVPGYPPGSKFIHQWRLIAALPVVHLNDLLPGQTYFCA